LPSKVTGFPERIDLAVYRHIVHKVMDIAQAVLEEDTTAEMPGILPVTGQDSPALTVLCTPLQVREHVTGMIYLQKSAKTGAFTGDELTLLNALAAHSALAVENAQLNRAVQEAIQAKVSYISLVSHELRTPMTSINGYTDLISKGAAGPVSDQQVNLLNVIRDNVDRMSALLSDLSDISRIETGGLKLQPTSFTLTGFIENSLRAIGPKLEKLDQSVSLEIPADPPKVFADPSRFVQVLNILLSNANSYTPPEGQIKVCVFPQGDVVRIEVSDSGAGISPEDQVQIFSSFFRSDDPLVREKQGWGLGLSVARGLVELMGGKIGVQSQSGRGSTFWFTLPVYQGIA
jgi:signal transduction histidine kinase